MTGATRNTPPNDWLRQGSAANYGSFGGGRDPIIRIGALGIIEILDPDIVFVCGSAVANGIFAALKAALNFWPSVFSSGRTKPNIIELPNLSAPGATCHFAFAKTFENWIARYRDSGSPSVYRRFTNPGVADSACSNAEINSGVSSRHATAALIVSARSRAEAASTFSADICDSKSWSRTRVPHIRKITPVKVTAAPIKEAAHPNV